METAIINEESAACVMSAIYDAVAEMNVALSAIQVARDAAEEADNADWSAEEAAGAVASARVAAAAADRAQWNVTDAFGALSALAARARNLTENPRKENDDET